MPRQAARLLHEALELSAEERAALADSLLESLDADVDAEQGWRDEIERRIKSIDEGTAQLVSWDDVYAHSNGRLRH